MPWQPTSQEIELIADMLAANRPKSAIAARVRARRQAAE
jgi:hypothetical protein